MDQAHAEAEKATNESAGDMHLPALAMGAAVGVMGASLFAGSVILAVVLALGAAIGGVVALMIAFALERFRDKRDDRRDRQADDRRPAPTRRPLVAAGHARPA